MTTLTSNRETKAKRAERAAAFREVQRLVADFHGVKLNDQEAEIIERASEDLLLAPSFEHPAVASAREAFETLMSTLESGRWVLGSEEQPSSAMFLRRAFAACTPPPS